MDEWFKQSLETYEREQQLYKQNIELSELTADELDRPKNRNKVAAQAALEQAQQRRLEALTKAGTTLVQQAAATTSLTRRHWKNYPECWNRSMISPKTG